MPRDCDKSDDRSIEEMRNLGPAVAKDLLAVGITAAQQVIDLGPEETFIRMLLGRQKIGRSAKCCKALYLYAIYGAIHDLDWRALSEKKKAEFKAFAKMLRESGRFK
jgi:hypothetical protein